MKHLKSKNIIIGLITLVSIMSVGFVVNSYYVKSDKTGDRYSEALNYTFTDDGSDFDGIPTGYKYYTGTTPENDAQTIVHYLKQKPNQEPWKQFWDGFIPSNPKYKKEDYTLVVKDLKIKKVDGSGNPIEGIQFCQVQEYKEGNKTKELENCGQGGGWVTNASGEVTVPINELNIGESYLIEKIKDDTKGVKINNQKVTLKEDSLKTEIPLYVDYGVRFLGEVKGKEAQGEEAQGEEVFITYNELLSKITGIPEDKIETKEGKLVKDDGLRYTRGIGDKRISVNIGNVLSKGNDSETGGNWLKIYDARAGKTLYIAKKPLTNNVSWNDLFNAGVVYGLDQIDITKIQEDGTIKQESPYTGDKGYKPKIIKIKDINGIQKKYIVRLLKGHNLNIHKGDPNTVITIYKDKDVTQNSEWNRYIIPLVKDYRYGVYSNGMIEPELQNGGKAEYLSNSQNFKIQLATYNWFGDLTSKAGDDYKYKDVIFNLVNDNGQMSWTQEYVESTSYRGFRGGRYTPHGAAYVGNYNPSYSTHDLGFRPVLEEITQKCYDDACFEGEVAGNKFITYNKLLSEITGIKEFDIKTMEKNGANLKYVRYIPGHRVNVNIGKVLNKGNDTDTGGNWLKIYDAHEGKTLYIAKKPLTNYVSWDDLYKAGVIYGMDMLDKDGKLNDSKINKSYTHLKYQGKIIYINNKPYIVRLLKGNKRKNWTPAQKVDNVKSLEMTQGSEWNRYILPLVKYNRFGRGTNQGEEIEDILKQDSNGIAIPWNNPNNKDYKIQNAKYKWFGDLTIYENSGGNINWMQEFGTDDYSCVVRGYNLDYYGASQTYSLYNRETQYYTGFRPVLEEITE